MNDTIPEIFMIKKLLFKSMVYWFNVKQMILQCLFVKPK